MEELGKEKSSPYVCNFSCTPQVSLPAFTKSQQCWIGMCTEQKQGCLGADPSVWIHTNTCTHMHICAYIHAGYHGSQVEISWRI